MNNITIYFLSAIQNDRDRIGPTKKLRLMKRSSSNEDDRLSLGSMSPIPRTVGDDKVIDYLHSAEKMCNVLRSKSVEQPKTVKDALARPCYLLEANNLPVDVRLLYLL